LLTAIKKVIKNIFFIIKWSSLAVRISNFWEQNYSLDIEFWPPSSLIIKWFITLKNRTNYNKMQPTIWKPDDFCSVFKWLGAIFLLPFKNWTILLYYQMVKKMAARNVFVFIKIKHQMCCVHCEKKQCCFMKNVKIYESQIVN
jgi:hypothetical protein